MRHARLWVGVIGIGVLVAALAWMLGGRASTPTEAEPVARVDPGEADPEREESLPPARQETEPQHMSPEAARDLASRLARALDGGLRRPTEPVQPGAAAGVTQPGAAPGATQPGAAAGATEPGAAADATEPGARAVLRIDAPRTAAERMDYAAGLHDLVVLRQDDLRNRLAELERTGQGDSPQAGRVRWEIERLEQAEPGARAQVEELAEEARREAPAP